MRGWGEVAVSSQAICRCLRCIYIFLTGCLWLQDGLGTLKEFAAALQVSELALQSPSTAASGSSAAGTVAEEEEEAWVGRLPFTGVAARGESPSEAHVRGVHGA